MWRALCVAFAVAGSVYGCEFTDGVCPSCGTCPSVSTRAIQCPPDSHTDGSGAAWPWDCACDTGRFGLPRCDLCPYNSYCPANASAPIPCPDSVLGIDTALQFTTSARGSVSPDACQCPYFATRVDMRCVRCLPANYVFNNTCLSCPSGSYCPGDGLAWPCNQWSECPAGTAGVGLQCANGSFFEPHVVAGDGSLNVTATGGGAWAVDGTRVWWNGTWYGGAAMGCADGAFGSVTDLLVVRDVLWIADPGCRAVRAVSSGGVWITALSNVTSRVLVLLPNGLILASDERSRGCIWAINPSTRFSNPMVCGMGRILGLAVIPREPFIVLAATAAYNISFLSSNLTLVDSFSTPTVPLRVAFAGAVVYGDGQLVYQLTSGGEWVNLLDLDVGPRFFASTPVSRFTSMSWNNSVFLLGTVADGLVALGVCNLCPANATTRGSTPGLGRCRCVKGRFMRNGCEMCPNGSYCPEGTVDPVPCPEGAWCAEGAGAPTLCDPSVFCAAGSIDAWGRGPNRATTLCTIGYYQTSAACIACPALSTTAGRSATSVVECVCASTDVGGRTLFTFLNETARQCQVCPATRYCPVGTVTPIECPPGTFCHEGVEAPQTCPVGFYCPGGLPDPVSCEPGTFCDVGSSTKATCRAQFYCPREATNELPCPAGFFCPTASGVPSPCPGGSFCVANVSAPAVCPVGSWCNASVAQPTPCPAFTTSLSHAVAPRDCFCVETYYGPGGDLCAACPTGGYSPPRSANLSDCACDTGFRLSGDFTACVACSVGEYCPGGEARSCPAGFVCSARSAVACPEGSYCPLNTILGLAAPIVCPPGGLCVAGAAIFVTCSAGFYCPGNTSEATRCPGGFFCPPASAVPIPCREGVQCAAGSVADTVLCSAGRYCPAGTAVGLVCPSGSYCPAAASAPAPCGEGYFCVLGSAAGVACPRATYCAGGSDSATPCPAGFACPLAGMSAPIMCVAGTYCPPESVDPTPCPGRTSANASATLFDCVCVAGSTPNASDGCVPCDAGTFKDADADLPCLPCDGAPAGATKCLPVDSGFPLLWVAIASAGGAVVVAGVGAYSTTFFSTGAATFGLLAGAVSDRRNVLGNVRITRLRTE